MVFFLDIFENKRWMAPKAKKQANHV